MAFTETEKPCRMTKLFKKDCFVLSAAHIHHISGSVVLVLLVFTFEEVGVKLPEPPVKVKPEQLRVTTAEYILGKERRR
jgi:hypothetical protein